MQTNDTNTLYLNLLQSPMTSGDCTIPITFSYDDIDYSTRGRLLVGGQRIILSPEATETILFALTSQAVCIKVGSYSVLVPPLP